MPTEITSNGELKDDPRNDLFRSEAVSEVISKDPGFLINYGSGIFSIVLIVAIVACWFIQYPDLISTKAKLTATYAPKIVITHTEGKLVKIKVKENDSVKIGQVVGYMESLANPSAIMEVSNQIDSINVLIRNNRTDEIVKYFPAYKEQQIFNGLGEIQSNYQTFIQSFITFKDFLGNGFYLHKKSMLFTDLKNNQKLNSILIKQKELLEKDLSLTNQTFQANESLAKDKVISSFDYRNEESKLIAKKLSLPQINAAIVNNESQQNEKRKEIAELENQIIVQKNTFVQAIQTFKSQVQAWEFKYVLKAPIAGNISFIGFLQENQEMKNGQHLFYVQPNNTTYFVEMLIPQYNFGKINKGQQVLLKFLAYPFEQYGAVVGKIEHINNLPTDSGYLAKVILPNGLITNYNKPLQYRDGLFAQADIITENMRLLERLYFNLAKQMNR
jgi:HlyD family secretion protein